MKTRKTRAGLTTPASLTNRILALRKQYGWHTDKTAECYDQVAAFFERAAQSDNGNPGNFRELVLLAGAFLEDDGEGEIVDDLAKIIHKSHGKLQKEFDAGLTNVVGTCTRRDLAMKVKVALCEIDHPGKGSGQDVAEDRRCLALAPATFWEGLEACYQKNGS